MKKAKVLFVSQEIFPYLDESPMANIGRYLPQGIQEKGKEIRTFMPRFGNVNERRNQLHEVIRLSGMNLIINDSDHPLIIKVASIQSARMQIYFIDNEEYFQRKHTLADENKNTCQTLASHCCCLSPFHGFLASTVAGARSQFRSFLSPLAFGGTPPGYSVDKCATRLCFFLAAGAITFLPAHRKTFQNLHSVLNQSVYIC